MYYYYARTSVSAKPIWWKKHLTTFQIVQFIIDVAVINFCLYVFSAVNHDRQWPLPTWSALGTGTSMKALERASEEISCYGTGWAAYTGWFIINSYLLLFIKFFSKTYAAKPSAARRPKKD
jgi:fatty acid elongase 3